MKPSWTLLICAMIAGLSSFAIYKIGGNLDAVLISTTLLLCSANICRAIEQSNK